MTTTSHLTPPGPPGPAVPDDTGHFGIYGGSFAPEALTAALDELTEQYQAAQADPAFGAELARLLRDYAGRPTLITEVPRFAAEAGGGRVFLKREDLTHTGSHKINNVLGQALLTRRMGKTRVIAETGAGQHGVATATACALFGLDCVVYMGEEDTRRQALNVSRMRMLGAEVISVRSGSRTLKDAMNEAFRDWVASVENTHYCIGSVGGPHPFPMMVRDFQRIIGVEASGGDDVSKEPANYRFAGRAASLSTFLRGSLGPNEDRAAVARRPGRRKGAGAVRHARLPVRSRSSR